MSNSDRQKWNAKYAEIAAGQPGDANHGGERPSSVLTSLAAWLPPRGRALDLAGGIGRHAIWLAQCSPLVPREEARAKGRGSGWNGQLPNDVNTEEPPHAEREGYIVTLADISPIALALAGQRAAAAGVSLNLLETDLEENAFPPGPWDVIVSVCYLHRPLFAAIQRELAPGGRLFVVQPTKLNLERHDKPPAAFLLDSSELPTLVPQLRVLHYQEGWLADGRHDAVLVAERM